MPSDEPKMTDLKKRPAIFLGDGESRPQIGPQIESDYLTEVAKDAAKWRMLKRRAQRHPNEKLITAVAETERG